MSKYIYQNHFTDRSGNVIEDGQVTVYTANTTSLATIYSSSGSSVVTGSVVTTGADGFFKFWVDNKDYNADQRFKIKLTKADFTTKEYDDITVFPEMEYIYYADAGATDQSVDGDDNSIADLLAEIGTTNLRTIVCKQGTYTFSTTIDWSAYTNVTLKVEAGANFAIANGVTITNGMKIEAGSYKWLSLTGTGTVSGLSYVNPLWFGVVQDWNGTTGTDNATALAAAFNAVAAGGKVEFPPVINKGISFSSNVAFDPHLAILEGNHNVFKYTGAGTAMTIGGDAQVIKNLTLIGNSTPGDIGFYHGNQNTGIIENVQVFGGFTTAFKMSGPNHGVIIHSGVDYNQSVVANDILSTTTWGGNVTTGFWLFSLGGQNPEGLTFIDCIVTNKTKTGTGWDVDAGINITIMNSVFQYLTTGLDIGAAAKVALINPWFEGGTIDTETVDASETTWTATGMGFKLFNMNFFQKNIGSGRTLATYGSSPAATAPLLYFYDDQATRATGVSLRGDSKTGAAVYGVQTAPTGGAAANEIFGGVVGKTLSNAAGVGVRGIGGGTADTYSGVFELGQFRIAGTTAPATAASAGTLGDVAIDSSYIYICTAASTWKRVAIASW